MPAFSLNWVMRLSQPSRATQLNTQASSACSATWLWLNTMCRFGIDAAGDEGRGDLADVAPELRGVLPHRDRVQVDDAIDAVVALLQRDELDDGAEIVAEMQIAGRLNPGKHQLLETHRLLLRIGCGACHARAAGRKGPAQALPAADRGHELAQRRHAERLQRAEIDREARADQDEQRDDARERGAGEVEHPGQPPPRRRRRRRP